MSSESPVSIAEAVAAAEIAPYAAAVITVEIDEHLYQLASEVLIDFPNVTMLKQDVLRNKNHFQPNVLETIHRVVNAAPGRKLKLVANLPYNIATPVISNLLVIDPVPVSLTVTIQRELADRIDASPRTKDYSALSVWVQALCDVEIIREMSPTVFWPRPKVHSAIMQIVPNPEKRAKIADLDFFHTFVRSMFFHRRKLLRNELLSAYKGQWEKPDVDALMAAMNLGHETRAEELDVATMLKLCNAVRERFTGK